VRKREPERRTVVACHSASKVGNERLCSLSAEGVIRLTTSREGPDLYNKKG